MVPDASQLLCGAQAALNTQYELTENTYFDRLYIWVMLAWACPRQLNFWLQVAPRATPPPPSPPPWGLSFRVCC